jgi:hypothetical protein
VHKTSVVYPGLDAAQPRSNPVCRFSSATTGSSAGDGKFSSIFWNVIHERHGQRDISIKEAASIVGSAIGKPDLEYPQLSSVILASALLQMGFLKKTAELIIERWSGAIAGLIARSSSATFPMICLYR